MSQALVAASRPRRSHRILLACLAVSGAIAARAPDATRREVAPIDPGALVCEARESPADAPPPRPPPPGEVYDGLEACLRVWRSDDSPGALGPSLRRDGVDVERVRHWIEVDGDPAWVETMDPDTWWVPLSDNGDSRHGPSGFYGGVRVSAAGAPAVLRCPWKHVN